MLREISATKQIRVCLDLRNGFLRRASEYLIGGGQPSVLRRRRNGGRERDDECHCGQAQHQESKEDLDEGVARLASIIRVSATNHAAQPRHKTQRPISWQEHPERHCIEVIHLN